MTLPSSLNMLTSSICAMGCTLSFLSAVCNFLSSVPELLCTFFTFRRGVPLPLFSEGSEECQLRVASPWLRSFLKRPLLTKSFKEEFRDYEGSRSEQSRSCLPCRWEDGLAETPRAKNVKGKHLMMSKSFIYGIKSECPEIIYKLNACSPIRTDCCILASLAWSILAGIYLFAQRKEGKRLIAKVKG